MFQTSLRGKIFSTYHFLDDSGDPGLSGTVGSSSHFVLAMVELPQRQPLSSLALIRQKLYLSPVYEFKYYKLTPVQKDAFFKEIQGLQFVVRATAICKIDFIKQHRQLSGQELVVELVSQLAISNSSIVNDILVMDALTAQMARSIRINLSHICQLLKRERPFKKITGANSKKEDGLQLADMIAGAIRHHTMGKEDRYYQTFQHKIAFLEEIKK